MSTECLWGWICKTKTKTSHLTRKLKIWEWILCLRAAADYRKSYRMLQYKKSAAGTFFKISFFVVIERRKGQEEKSISLWLQFMPQNIYQNTACLQSNESLTLSSQTKKDIIVTSLFIYFRHLTLLSLRPPEKQFKPSEAAKVRL